MKRSVMVLALVLVVILSASAENAKKLSLSNVDGDLSTGSDTGNKAPSVSAPALSTNSIRLENDSDRLVFFAVIPLKPGELSGWLAQPKMAIDGLRGLREKMDYLAPSTVAATIPVSDAEQIILGFEVESGTSAYPLWYVSIPPKAKRVAGTFYQLSSVKPLLDDQGQRAIIRPVDFDLPATAIRIDGRFVDWLKFQDTMTYPQSSRPLRITRQTDTGIENINLENALSFQRGGTDIEHLRVVRTKTDLLVMVSSHSVMSKGLSYLLRLYANAQETTNRYTLEIPVDGVGGPVLLWTSGKKDPLILGNYAIADYYAEARFSLTALPAGLSRLFAGDWIMELSSAWTDQAMSEEFFWGRFPAASILRTD